MCPAYDSHALADGSSRITVGETCSVDDPTLPQSVSRRLKRAAHDAKPALTEGVIADSKPSQAGNGRSEVGAMSDGNGWVRRFVSSRTQVLDQRGGFLQIGPSLVMASYTIILSSFRVSFPVLLCFPSVLSCCHICDLLPVHVSAQAHASKRPSGLTGSALGSRHQFSGSLDELVLNIMHVPSISVCWGCRDWVQWYACLSCDH